MIDENTKKLVAAWKKSATSPGAKKALRDFKKNAAVTIGKPLIGAAAMGGVTAAIPGAHEAVPYMAAAGAAIAGTVGTIQGYPLKTATAAGRYIAHRTLQTARNYRRSMKEETLSESERLLHQIHTNPSTDKIKAIIKLDPDKAVRHIVDGQGKLLVGSACRYLHYDLHQGGNFTDHGHMYEHDGELHISNFHQNDASHPKIQRLTNKGFKLFQQKHTPMKVPGR